MAPWMLPPDESGELGARAAAHHLASARAASAFPNDQQVSNYCCQCCDYFSWTLFRIH